MNILGYFRYELYGRLLYGNAPVYFDQPVYLKKVNNKYVPSSWLTFNLNFCDSLSSYIIESQYIGRSKEVLTKLDYDSTSSRSETMFFVFAAHIVFVPFGNPGYEFLKKKVEEKFNGKDVGEFLYEKFIERTRSKHYEDGALHGLNDEQKEYIKEFFVNFKNREEISFAIPKDVATLACRLFFTLDGLQNSENSLDDLKSKYIKPIYKIVDDQIKLDDPNYINYCKISDFEKMIPNREALNKHEEKYILKLFNLGK